MTGNLRLQLGRQLDNKTVPCSTPSAADASWTCKWTFHEAALTLAPDVRIISSLPLGRRGSFTTKPMPINSDKPHLWKQDIQASVDQFNKWFMRLAPKAYRDTRIKTTKHVEEALLHTTDLLALAPALLGTYPEILPTLRMCCCPPIARDRLIGLASVRKSLIGCMEKGKIPPKIPKQVLDDNLLRICSIFSQMLDIDIFPWLAAKQRPSKHERHRASTIVADRLCGAVSDPIVRNAQEKRQLAVIAAYLKRKGYFQKPHPAGKLLNEMEAGTFAFRMNVVVGTDRQINIPIDVVVQRRKPRPALLPVLFEAKSVAISPTSTSVARKKRRKCISSRRRTAPMSSTSYFSAATSIADTLATKRRKG